MTDSDRDDDPQLAGLRAVWLSLPDEEPPQRGLEQLMAAARVKADEMARRSAEAPAADAQAEASTAAIASGKTGRAEPAAAPWWRRALSLLRRPPVLALASVAVIAGGAVVVLERREALEDARGAAQGRAAQRADDSAAAAERPRAAALPASPEPSPGLQPTAPATPEEVPVPARATEPSTVARDHRRARGEAASPAAGAKTEGTASSARVPDAKAAGGAPRGAGMPVTGALSPVENADVAHGPADTAGESEPSRSTSASSVADDSSRAPVVATTGADARSGPPMPSVVIEVPVGGDVLVNGNRVADRQLDAVLRAAAARDPSTKVVIRSHRDVAYARIVDLLDRGKRAGLRSFALSTF